MAKRPSKRKPNGGTVKGPAGRTFTKKITRGPNKGDTVTFKVAPSRKPYPVKVVQDVGNPSTLRDNPGVKFSKKNKKK